MNRRIQTFLGWCFFLFWVTHLFADVPEDLLSEYSAAMNRLAEESEERGMTLEAKVTRSRLWENSSYGFVFPRLSEKRIESLPDDALSQQEEWFQKLRSIEKKFGRKFLELARESAEEGKGIRGYRYAEIGFFIDPDNEELREIFGYTFFQDQWYREWEVEQLKKGFLRDPVYGWISLKEKERLEGKKNSKEEKKKISNKITVETEHFEITATETRQKALELGEYLEHFYTVWNYLFFPMIVSEKESAGIVLGSKKRRENRYKIFFYRTRDEYLHEVLRIDSGGTVSNGGYFSGKKRVYLYTPDSNDENESPLNITAVHEVTHQLLAESFHLQSAAERRKYDPGEESLFWITEGIAAYMETFKEDPSVWSVGGLKSYRFLRAQERVEEPDGLLPIQQLMEMGKEEFQRYENLPQLYTESAGLTSFFLHGEGGKYREIFLKSLCGLYRGEETPVIFEEHLGQSWKELEREFRNYLRETPFEE